MVVYEKIYLEAYTNGQYISHKNNTAQLYFTRAQLCSEKVLRVRDSETQTQT